LGILGVMAGKLLGKKCLLRAESCGEMDGSFVSQYGRPPSKLKSLLIKILVRLRNMALTQADGFLSISSAITNEFVRAGVPLNTLTEITNGIDVQRFAPIEAETKAALKKKLGLLEKKYFLYTGRLTRGKGLEYLLRVWKRLAAEFKDIHLIVVGSGQGHTLSCEDNLKTFVRENHLESTVTFTGGVPNVNEYLQAGDFFVFPSQSEGLGLSLIEAQACGLACIATNVGGILDIVEDKVNGLLVPYADEDRLFEVMKEVLQDKEKAIQLGREGRKTVLEKFDINRLAKQYLALFNRLAEGVHS
jgi:glycosyltransferase involved in cell wall biosynthesis